MSRFPTARARWQSTLAATYPHAVPPSHLLRRPHLPQSRKNVASPQTHAPPPTSNSSHPLPAPSQTPTPPTPAPRRFPLKFVAIPPITTVFTPFSRSFCSKSVPKHAPHCRFVISKSPLPKPRLRHQLRRTRRRRTRPSNPRIKLDPPATTACSPSPPAHTPPSRQSRETSPPAPHCRPTTSFAKCGCNSFPQCTCCQIQRQHQKGSTRPRAQSPIPQPCAHSSENAPQSKMPRPHPAAGARIACMAKGATNLSTSAAATASGPPPPSKRRRQRLRRTRRRYLKRIRIRRYEIIKHIRQIRQVNRRSTIEIATRPLPRHRAKVIQDGRKIQRDRHGHPHLA